MNKFIKAGIAALLILGTFFCGYRLSAVICEERLRRERELDRQFEEYAKSKQDLYVYPQENTTDRGISITYTQDVLARKAEGEPLTEEEEGLIMYYFLQDNGYGLAVTLFHEYGNGMGIGSRRVWESSSGGKFWNVLSEGTYSTGIYEYTYMDNVFIEAGFATTAEEGRFNISEDRGHSFESIAYDEIFDYEGVAFAKKTGEDRKRKTVTYEWIDLYTREIISTVEYDLAMNEVGRR